MERVRFKLLPVCSLSGCTTCCAGFRLNILEVYLHREHIKVRSNLTLSSACLWHGDCGQQQPALCWVWMEIEAPIWWLLGTEDPALFEAASPVCTLVSLAVLHCLAPTTSFPCQ